MCPGAWSPGPWGGWGKVHTCPLAPLKKNSNPTVAPILPTGWEDPLSSAAPPLYSDRKGPPGSSITWYGGPCEGVAVVDSLVWAQGWEVYQNLAEDATLEVACPPTPVAPEKTTKQKRKRKQTSLLHKKGKTSKNSDIVEAAARDLTEWWMSSYGTTKVVVLHNPLGSLNATSSPNTNTTSPNPTNTSPNTTNTSPFKEATKLIPQLDGGNSDSSMSSDSESDTDSSDTDSELPVKKKIKPLEDKEKDMHKKHEENIVPDDEYFKTEKEMVQFQMKLPNSILAYIGNLKYHEAYKILKDGHIALRKSTNGVAIAPNKPEHIVVLKCVKYKTQDGEKKIICVCLDCHEVSTSQCFIKAVGKEDVISDHDIKTKVKACDHALAAEFIFRKEEAKAAAEKSENAVVLRDGKLTIAACFDPLTQSYGIVFCRRSRGGNKGKCYTCKQSLKCSHVKVWNEEETFEESNKIGNKYDEMKEVYPTYIPGSCCKHNNPWDGRDPIAEG